MMGNYKSQTVRRSGRIVCCPRRPPHLENEQKFNKGWGKKDRVLCSPSSNTDGHTKPPSPKTPTLPRHPQRSSRPWSRSGESGVPRGFRPVPRGVDGWVPSISLLALLLALWLVCTSNRLLVLLSRLVNSVKLSLLTLLTELRFS